MNYNTSKRISQNNVGFIGNAATYVGLGLGILGCQSGDPVTDSRFAGETPKGLVSFNAQEQDLMEKYVRSLSKDLGLKIAQNERAYGDGRVFVVLGDSVTNSAQALNALNEGILSGENFNNVNGYRSLEDCVETGLVTSTAQYRDVDIGYVPFETVTSTTSTSDPRAVTVTTKPERKFEIKIKSRDIVTEKTYKDLALILVADVKKGFIYGVWDGNYIRELKDREGKPVEFGKDKNRLDLDLFEKAQVLYQSMKELGLNEGEFKGELEAAGLSTTYRVVFSSSEAKTREAVDLYNSGEMSGADMFKLGPKRFTKGLEEFIPSGFLENGVDTHWVDFTIDPKKKALATLRKK